MWSIEFVCEHVDSIIVCAAPKKRPSHAEAETFVNGLDAAGSGKINADAFLGAVGTIGVSESDVSGFVSSSRDGEGFLDATSATKFLTGL